MEQPFNCRRETETDASAKRNRVPDTPLIRRERAPVAGFDRGNVAKTRQRRGVYFHNSRHEWGCGWNWSVSPTWTKAMTRTGQQPLAIINAAVDLRLAGEALA